MNIEQYIIGMYNIGVDIDRITDSVYNILSDSYYKRYNKAYSYISFGKITRKECQEMVMSTIFKYVKHKDDIRKGY